MKKRLLTLVLALSAALGANAQFEKDKVYVGASLTGIDLSYSGTQKLHLGLQADGGYMVAKNWLVKGQLGFNLSSRDEISDTYLIGVGGRRYFDNNGIFVGANVKYVHGGKGYNDFMPGVEAGWAFFLNGTVTLEPAVYYDQSFKSHKDFSTFGVRLGIGLYLFKK